MPDDPTPTPAAAAATGGPLFSYDVPQEVAYSGQSFIDLQVPLGYFAAQTPDITEGQA